MNMTEEHSRYEVARKILIFWCLFIGVGAVSGSLAMLIKTDGSLIGMENLIPYFQVLPFAKYLFQDFLFPGIALLCVNGLTNLGAAILLAKRKKLGIILGMTFGFTLMAWIVIQFIIFPLNFMSTIYFIFGLLQSITGYAALTFYKQEEFSVSRSDYENIGTNPRELVVYFSRMGYTRKAAYIQAEKSGGKLLEIKAKERTKGTLGFWWCGRFGMHKWDMPIEDVEIDLWDFDKVTICTPIWVFNIAAPVRTFCKMAKGKIKKVDYVLVHYQKANYEGAVDEMNQLLSLRGEKALSICSRKGKVVFQREIF